MRNISIFAKTPHYRSRTRRFRYPHLLRGSSKIRGEQISEYLGAKYNPSAGYEDDLCIYVKSAAGDFQGIKGGSYVDVVDSWDQAKRLFNYPEIGIIVCSQTSYEYLKEKQFKNNIVFIPQHHCNFERILRDRKEITTVGMIGSIDSFDYPHDEFKKQMKQIGLDFKTYFSFKDRNDIVDFYRQIDIQVSWNLHTGLFKNPLRIVNAASFGIPTVAFPETAYKECDGNYIAVKTMEELIVEVKKMKDENYYNQWPGKIANMAESYHIGKIAEKYRQLCV